MPETNEAPQPGQETSAGVEETRSRNLGDREKYRQCRWRKPKHRSDEVRDASSQEFYDVYDLIPEIGSGFRWYDLPYLILRWLLYGKPRRLLSLSARRTFASWLTNLVQFNAHHRNRAQSLDSANHNLSVPEDEHVTTLAVWVVELFLPTELPELERAIQRNGWNRLDFTSQDAIDNRTRVERARAGSGWSWWPLADIASESARWTSGDAERRVLPAEFDSVELKAIQIGGGMTAVLAEFSMSEYGEVVLDNEWHSQHEPILNRTAAGMRPLDRQFAAFHSTQTERRRLHTLARSWLAGKLPGAFGGHGRPQPLLDLLVLDSADPTVSGDEQREHGDWRSQRDALRALALDPTDLLHRRSDSYPGLVLSPMDDRLHNVFEDDPTWTLWGNREVASGSLEERSMFGGDQDRALIHRVGFMRNLLLMWAVSEFQSVAERSYAAVRDRAITQHGKFRPKALEALRRSFLTLSLNLATASRDAAAFWERSGRFESDPQFDFSPELGVKSAPQPDSWKRKLSGTFNIHLRTTQDEKFAALLEADRSYREILSTVASLGSSVDAFKIGRWALWVAFASLGVALVAIVFAQVGCESLVHQLLGWPPIESCRATP